MTRAMKVLVTGAAGFIGHHVTRRLAETGRCEVLGIDTLDAYYDPALKRARVDRLAGLEGFRFVQADCADAEKFPALVPTGGRTTWCTSRRSRGCGTV